MSGPRPDYSQQLRPEAAFPNAASSSGVVGILRCVDRCWPNAGMPARRMPSSVINDPRTRGGGRDLEVSFCSLCQDQLVQRQIRDRSPQTIILGLQLLEPLQLIAFQAAILIDRKST